MVDAIIFHHRNHEVKLMRTISKEHEYMGHGEISNEKSRVSLLLPTKMKEELARMALAEDRSLSYIIVRILEQYLDEKPNYEK